LGKFLETLKTKDLSNFNKRYGTKILLVVAYNANHSLSLTIFLMVSFAIFGFCIILKCKGLKNWQV
jgi:hypothetical protein